MTKIKLICNHCGCDCMWYSSMMNEMGFYRISGDSGRMTKIYCADCLHDIARQYIEMSKL
jgi:hypothetical protein